MGNTPVTVDSTPTEILKSMTPAQHKTWRETGATPELKEAASVDSPSTAKTEVVEEPKTPEKVAEPTTASAEPSVSRGKNAETRIKELLADNKRLSSELEAARKPVAAAQAKKDEAIAKPHRNDVDEKTGLAKYATDDDFLDARDKYVSDMASKQTRADIAKEDGERRVAEQNAILQKKWLNSLTIAKEAHADFDKVCEIDSKGAFQNAELKKIKGGGALDRFCLDTQRGGDVLYYLAAHPGEVDRIQAIDSLEEIAEALVELKKNSLATAEPAKKDEGSKPQVTKAPAPATDVGGKATAPADEAEAALKRGDFRSYMKEENRKELLAKKKAS